MSDYLRIILHSICGLVCAALHGISVLVFASRRLSCTTRSDRLYSADSASNLLLTSKHR